MGSWTTWQMIMWEGFYKKKHVLLSWLCLCLLNFEYSTNFNAIKNIKIFINIYFVCNSRKFDKPCALNGKIISFNRLHIWWMFTKFYVYHNVIFYSYVFVTHEKRRNSYSNSIMHWCHIQRDPMIFYNYQSMDPP